MISRRACMCTAAGLGRACSKQPHPPTRLLRWQRSWFDQHLRVIGPELGAGLGPRTPKGRKATAARPWPATRSERVRGRPRQKASKAGPREPARHITDPRHGRVKHDVDRKRSTTPRRKRKRHVARSRSSQGSARPWSSTAFRRKRCLVPRFSFLHAYLHDVGKQPCQTFVCQC